MAKKQRIPRQRNPVAHHVFIHRGGEHRKSNAAKRQEGKRQLRKLVETGGGFSAPDFFRRLVVTLLSVQVSRWLVPDIRCLAGRVRQVRAARA